MTWSVYSDRNRAADQPGTTVPAGVFYPPCESPLGVLWIAEFFFASVRSYAHDNEKLKMYKIRPFGFAQKTPRSGVEGAGYNCDSSSSSTNSGGTDASAPFHSAQHDKNKLAWVAFFFDCAKRCYMICHTSF